jgi:hypothetical protein
MDNNRVTLSQALEGYFIAAHARRLYDDDMGYRWGVFAGGGGRSSASGGGRWGIGLMGHTPCAS